MLLLSLAALLSFCAAEGNDKKQDLIVKTTQAVPVSHQGDKEFSFIARPFRTSELSFRVGGPIDRFDVYAGNRYQQGSIIAEIDPRDFRIRKERAEAIYHQAKAEFERIQKLYGKGKVFARRYKAKKTQDEEIEEKIEKCMKNSRNPMSFVNTITAALLNGAVDEESVIDELERIVQKRKKEIL